MTSVTLPTEALSRAQKLQISEELAGMTTASWDHLRGLASLPTADVHALLDDLFSLALLGPAAAVPTPTAAGELHSPLIEFRNRTLRVLRRSDRPDAERQRIEAALRRATEAAHIEAFLEASEASMHSAYAEAADVEAAASRPSEADAMSPGSSADRSEGASRIDPPDRFASESSTPLPPG